MPYTSIFIGVYGLLLVCLGVWGVVKHQLVEPGEYEGQNRFLKDRSAVVLGSFYVVLGMGALILSLFLAMNR